MKINKLKYVTILGNKFKMVWNKTHAGGSFSFTKEVIEIGTSSLEFDPVYTLSIISHEVMEIILYSLGARFDNPRLSNRYLFSFEHQTFENAIQIHTEVMAKFINQK